MMRIITTIAAIVMASLVPLRAELRLPAIFGDHMVLQQKQANPIWGWDTPKTRVTVSFANQTQSAVADNNGKWEVKLAPLLASEIPRSLVITGSSRKEISDVLVGEVWLCSGQSNMEFQLRRDSNGDLDRAAAQIPGVRLISVPHVGTQTRQGDFEGSWALSTPASASDFCAVGFLFGRYLHQILHVPVGLINATWGGAAAEAFIPRPALERDERFKALMERTVEHERLLLADNGEAEYARAMAKWELDAARALAEKRGSPARPQRFLEERQRPANIYGGMINPLVGYGIKGVIWYQGEQNVGRPKEYRDLFSCLIGQWREEWRQGDFPFYWVQLPNFGRPALFTDDSAWAEVREAQTRTMQLPNTGQAVIIDLGEGKDIHPHNKHDVAARLVRWALVKDYGLGFPYRSPEFKKFTVANGKVVVTFDCFGSKLRTFGVSEACGFAVSARDGKWYPATGVVVGADAVELTCEHVDQPVAVRYAWSDNPICNLYSDADLPVTPFRTDG